MAVPTSVMQLLENQNVAYNIASTGLDSNIRDLQLRQLGAAKSVLLQDDQGKLLVLIPANCLLDLNAACRETGRSLRPIATIDLKSYFDKNQLSSIPAFPKLGGISTLVDRHLLNVETLFLDAGSNEALVTVTQPNFATLIDDARICDISTPITSLEHFSNTDEDDIFNAVKNFTTLRIKQRLEETIDLPPLPQTAQRIIKLRVDPNADISDLANIVETDPSLAAQVVSWAASPYYSAPGKIKSIHDAIVRVLGFDMVLNLALGLSLGKTLSMPKDGPRGRAGYWHQAVYTAAAVEGLVTAIPRERRPGFGMAYLSGLLHNFGYLILSEVFPPQFSNICRHIEANNHLPAQVIEKHIVGISRDQLASWLMQLWNLPEEVVVALRQQNNPSYDGDHSVYSQLLFVAQRLLQQRGICPGPHLEIPDSVYRQLNLDPVKASSTIDNILASSDELNSIASSLENY